MTNVFMQAAADEIAIASDKEAQITKHRTELDPEANKKMTIANLAVVAKGLGLDAVKNKVEFYQGDACNLKPTYTGYDLVLAANLIDRLYEPSKLLTTIHERVIKGGLLMITSPYTWLEEHTKKEEWVGGFKEDGENVSTLDGLKKLLSSHFKLIQGPQALPFVIRETRRKFQHTLSEVTIWEKID